MSTTETLEQCLTTTWDGDLISKTERDHWYKLGYVARKRGYNFITAAGVEQLFQAGTLDRSKK